MSLRISILLVIILILFSFNTYSQEEYEAEITRIQLERLKQETRELQELQTQTRELKEELRDYRWSLSEALDEAQEEKRKSTGSGDVQILQRQSQAQPPRHQRRRCSRYPCIHGAY